VSTEQTPDRKDSPQQIKVLLRHDGTAFRTETRSSRLSSRSFNSPVSGSRAAKHDCQATSNQANKQGDCSGKIAVFKKDE
jgi:hypothetical protein